MGTAQTGLSTKQPTKFPPMGGVTGAGSRANPQAEHPARTQGQSPARSLLDRSRRDDILKVASSDRGSAEHGCRKDIAMTNEAHGIITDPDETLAVIARAVARFHPELLDEVERLWSKAVELARAGHALHGDVHPTELEHALRAES